MPPRKDTEKGKATSTAPAKAKATSAPPQKKRKGGKLLPVKQPHIHNLKANGNLESKAYPPQCKDWYKCCRPKHIHVEATIHECRLQAKYQAIWRSINELGLSYVFQNCGEININLVREFYAGFDPEDLEQLVPIRERLIDISASTICNFLGALDVPGEPLDHFIVRPTYRELRHTLCGVNSVATWVRDKKTNRHRKFPKKNMKAKVKVWLNCERTCVLYFLMMGQRVNVVHLIRYQMNQYLRQEEVEEKKEFGHIITPPLRSTDPTNIWVKKESTRTSLTGAERNSRDDNFMAHLYGMMDLQLRIGGRPATTEERVILEQQYSLNAHAQQLVGICDGYKLPEDEDVNTPEQSEAEPEKSDDEDDDDDDDEEAQDEEWAASEDEGDGAT
ncbi:hypothetical protein A4A49_52609 [Nicotiana attenuata]|uniref:Putative plant transposon protein domain-containing protein n=1 Tax=Nicotiana attenuata TaxID=49451 RepID=A0A1J6HWK3_NICAT|nr:hypothetical protein A4A49_52609 [Nicotiana attenuata]